MGQVVGYKEDLQVFNDLDANLIHYVFQMGLYYLVIIHHLSQSPLYLAPEIVFPSLKACSVWIASEFASYLKTKLIDKLYWEHDSTEMKTFCI